MLKGVYLYVVLARLLRNKPCNRFVVLIEDVKTKINCIFTGKFYKYVSTEFVSIRCEWLLVDGYLQLRHPTSTTNVMMMIVLRGPFFKLFYLLKYFKATIIIRFKVTWPLCFLLSFSSIIHQVKFPTRCIVQLGRVLRILVCVISTRGNAVKHFITKLNAKENYGSQCAAIKILKVICMYHDVVWCLFIKQTSNVLLAPTITTEVVWRRSLLLKYMITRYYK